MTNNSSHETSSEPSLFNLLKPYRAFVVGIILFTIAANALNLVVPKIMSHAIDTYAHGAFDLKQVVLLFSLVAIFIFIFTYLQSLMQTYTAERVARDLRTRVAAKISEQEYSYIQEVTPAKLLTNLTSDVDAVKNFVSQAIGSIISSAFLIVGASILLLITDWKLGLAVLVVVPFIAGTFFTVLTRVRKLFKKAQEAIDWLNKVINESILGAALIRLVHSDKQEYDKFIKANATARDIGLSILALFSKLIPIITFATNIATLIIVMLGGHFVITGAMTLGDFTAFTNYLIILIFPIMVIGFMSNVIAQATASYLRIGVVLGAPDKRKTGSVIEPLKGSIVVQNMWVRYGERVVLKDISFTIQPGTRTAIIGPTAAGKTQLLNVLTGLLLPTAGDVLFDGRIIGEYEPVAFHNQVGLVFQDSIIFNATLRENIAFNAKVSEADLEKAIATAELGEFIETLPEKLNTVVSERGMSLSGGQKQRVMLARALALNPVVLLLDDFTARVDANTERKILDNVRRNYLGTTLISVTQKIAPIEDYDQIILLMEGEVLAIGTHAELMKSSPEYVQIYNSQQSTSTYEVHA